VTAATVAVLESVDVSELDASARLVRVRLADRVASWAAARSYLPLPPPEGSGAPPATLPEDDAPPF
jgi:hypothetical protein